MQKKWLSKVKLGLCKLARLVDVSVMRYLCQGPELKLRNMAHTTVTSQVECADVESNSKEEEKLAAAAAAANWADIGPPSITMICGMRTGFRCAGQG